MLGFYSNALIDCIHTWYRTDAPDSHSDSHWCDTVLKPILQRMGSLGTYYSLPLPLSHYPALRHSYRIIGGSCGCEDAVASARARFTTTGVCLDGSRLCAIRHLDESRSQLPLLCLHWVNGEDFCSRRARAGSRHHATDTAVLLRLLDVIVTSDSRRGQPWFPSLSELWARPVMERRVC